MKDRMMAKKSSENKGKKEALGTSVTLSLPVKGFPVQHMHL